MNTGYKSTIPESLRAHLPRLYVELGARRNAYPLTVLGYGLLLYALSRHYNCLSYLLFAVCGPLLGVLFHRIRPLNPYSSLDAEIEGMNGTSDDSKKRVVELLRSRGVQRVQMRTGLANSGGMAIAALLVLFLGGGSPSCEFDISLGLVLMSLFGLSSLGLQIHYSLDWLFRAWENPAMWEDRPG